MNKIRTIILSGIVSVMACSALTASGLDQCIGMHAKDIPGIGLISDSIEFDGITLSHFRFDNDKKYTYVEPEQEVAVHMHYDIDASLLKTLHLHHLVIGLYDDGPQQCILHSLGVIDSHGVICTTVKAPKKPGVYQVRFCHASGLSDSEAQTAWWRADGPSAKTIVGIIVVK